MPDIADSLPGIKVDVSMDGPYVVLVPRDPVGADVFQRIVDGMPDTLRWHFYGSRFARNGGAEELVGVRYACGGTSRRHTVDSLTQTVYDGAIVVNFDLTDLQGNERYVLREYGYLSRVTMEADSTGQRIRLRAAACKVCGSLLSRPIELEWKTCDVCAAACEHSYAFGAGTANRMVVYLPFCSKCGRVDPSWEPSSDPVADMLKTVSEGALDMLVLRHDDDSLTTITRL